MHEWLQKLGHRQQSILSRLSKNAVRNHENIREGGEGGAPASEGSFGANQAHSFQQSIAGYASQNVPGAQAIFNATGFGMNSGHAKGDFGGRGVDARIYLEGESGSGGSPVNFVPPPGPPPPNQSSYSPSHYPPSHYYPSAPAPAPAPLQYDGYTPSYTSPLPPMSAPGAPGGSGFPSFPSSEFQVAHEFPTPSGGPGFPGNGPTLGGGHAYRDGDYGGQGTATGFMFPVPGSHSYGPSESFNDVRTGGGFQAPEGLPPGFPSFDGGDGVGEHGQHHGYGYPHYPPRGPPGW